MKSEPASFDPADTIVETVASDGSVKRERPPASSSRRRWFRFAAVLFGLSLVLVLEGALRMTGLGVVEDVGDPYVGFDEVKPLFVLNQAGDQFEIAKDRQRFFRPDSFVANKLPNEFRVFCLGGSTVQGRPYAIETSFTTWLELSLRAAAPARDWEVVNCGGVSYASYRLVPILQEVLDYQPDAIVIYTGHNEFLEARSYPGLANRPRWLRNGHRSLCRSRLYGIAHNLVGSSSKPVSLTAEVDALLDYRGGMEEYHRDDSWRRGVVEHFEVNLRRMTELAAKANVPVILVNPACNFRDSPPFKAELAPELNEKDQAEFSRRWKIARESSWNDLNRKLNDVRSVLDLDPRHAEVLFLLGRVYEKRGQFDSARQAYALAKDEDVCPLRILESMHEILKTAGKRNGVWFVDIRKVLEQDAKDGLLGHTQFLDHVHPRIVAHQQIAQRLTLEVLEIAGQALQDGWKPRCESAYEVHFRSISPAYYLQGEERLRGLRGWSQGRAEKIRSNR